VRAPQITDVLVSFGDVGRSHCALEEERWHAMLTRIAEERGYRPTWVGCTYRQRFGSWPTGNPASIEPDAEVLSFVEAEIAAWRRRQRAERKAEGCGSPCSSPSRGDDPARRRRPWTLCVYVFVRIGAGAHHLGGLAGGAPVSRRFRDRPLPCPANSASALTRVFRSTSTVYRTSFSTSSFFTLRMSSSARDRLLILHAR
jgi:hypothetical protein